MRNPCRFRQGEEYGACDDKAKALGVSPPNAYELMHDPDFSVLRVGSRMVMPKELFFLNIGHGTITVYAYLLYCENRSTHQYHPSYQTISAAVHLTVSTV